MNRFWNIWHAQKPHSPQKWVPILGELQKTLQKGEYLPLCPIPMFESNFVQVTNCGSPVFVHHRANKVTMGVAASLPGLVLPDILLTARPRGQGYPGLVLTRLIPLRLVHLYVHDMAAWRLKLRLVTGRCYYLALEAPDHEVGFLFNRWIHLINLLRGPAATWVPRTLCTSPKNRSSAPAPASTWHFQDRAHGRCAGPAPVAKPTFSYNVQMAQKQRKTKRRFRSQAVGDSVPLVWSQLGHVHDNKKPTKEKFQPDAYPDSSNTKIHIASETAPSQGTTCVPTQGSHRFPEDSGSILPRRKASITIRTIFSIISNTINQEQTSSKTCTSDSDGAARWEDLLETPSHCVSSDSPDFTLLRPYDCLETLLWQQVLEDLIDPDSSTPSSSTLVSSSYPHPIYLFPPCPSFPRSHDKAGQMASGLGPGPPPSRKASPGRWWKAPFIMDQSQKVPAVPAPSQRIPVRPAPPQKALVMPTPSQRAPVRPAQPQKARIMAASPQKASIMPVPPQKAPVMPVPSHRVPVMPALSPKAPVRPTPSQKAPTKPAPPHKFPIVRTPFPEASALRALSLKAPVIPRSSQKAPPTSTISQKTRDTPGPSHQTPVGLAAPQKPPPLSQKVPANPQKAVSSPAPKKEFPALPTLSQKTPITGLQHQMAVLSPTRSREVPAQLDERPGGAPGGGIIESGKGEGTPQPMAVVEALDTNMMETKTHKTSLELPSTTATKELEEVLRSKTWEVTQGDLRGRGRLESKACHTKEEVTLDMPDMRSTEVGQRKRWVKTQEVATEGPHVKHSRSFSVEGLALAKLMIMANSKQQPLRPPLASLPFWLPMTSQASTMSAVASLSFGPNRLSLQEGAPVVVREQPEFHSRKDTQHQWVERELPQDPVGPSKVPLSSMPKSDSPKMATTSQVPIPLPASLWEDLPSPPLPEAPVLRTEALARVPQQPTGISQEPKRKADQNPLATRLSPETLQPVLLEIDSMSGVAKKAGRTKEKPHVLHPSASTWRS
ncbi:Golgi-associated RAB2 interactor protein 5B [Ctenodactylus gundi]